MDSMLSEKADGLLGFVALAGVGAGGVGAGAGEASREGGRDEEIVEERGWVEGATLRRGGGKGSEGGALETWYHPLSILHPVQREMMMCML
jgi:hypothetical protein